MHEPSTILLVAHGYPPKECAGTERHTEALANALSAQGHRVHVLAATRAPGRPQYELLRSGNVTRVVNNIATRALADGESDPNIDRIAATIETEIKPDVVHIHHTQFLSSTMRFNAPTVVTLHDQWAWCASGGLGLKNGDHLCEGPDPARFAQCHAEWRPAPSRSARWLTRAAAAASPLVNPDRLHRIYQRLPGSVRPSPVRGGVHTETPDAAEHRNSMVLNWHRNADALIAPSQHLANQASEHQLGPIAVIRHGLSDEWFAPRTAVAADAPFVHIGTIAKHKGTDLVVSAHRALDAAPRLVLHGSILDPEAALGHPVGRTLDPGGVRAALQKARALVLGSRWPENAPLIIIEARAAGCPIIAPRIGGIPELIEDGVDGILYAPNDEVDLRDAMKRLLDGPPLKPRPPPNFRDQLARIEAIYRRVQRQSA